MVWGKVCDIAEAVSKQGRAQMLLCCDSPGQIFLQTSGRGLETLL